jgi:hypothetical protein
LRVGTESTNHHITQGALPARRGNLYSLLTLFIRPPFTTNTPVRQRYQAIIVAAGPWELPTSYQPSTPPDQTSPQHPPPSNTTSRPRHQDHRSSIRALGPAYFLPVADGFPTTTSSSPSDPTRHPNDDHEYNKDFNHHPSSSRAAGNCLLPVLSQDQHTETHLRPTPRHRSAAAASVPDQQADRTTLQRRRGLCSNQLASHRTHRSSRTQPDRRRPAASASRPAILPPSALHSSFSNSIQVSIHFFYVQPQTPPKITKKLENQKQALASAVTDA